jgi:hypothetical protein
MKKILLLFPVVFLTVCCNYHNENKQNSDHIISMDGIGELKIGMKQAELEKLLNQKFVLKNARDTGDSWNDSATVKYKDIDVQLSFQREYTEGNNFYMYLIGLRTSSPLCKTGSGIGMDTERSKIIAAYEDGYLSLSPDFEDDSTANRSKTKSLVNIKNENGNRQIIFYLNNKKVIGLEAGIVFHDSE